jgi:hypothetical protein
LTGKALLTPYETSESRTLQGYEGVPLAQPFWWQRQWLTISTTANPILGDSADGSRKGDDRAHQELVKVTEIPAPLPEIGANLSWTASSDWNRPILSKADISRGTTLVR